MKAKHLSYILLALIIGFLIFVAYQKSTKNENSNTSSIITIHSMPTENTNWINNEITAIESQTPNLDREALKMSLIAYENAKKKGLINNPLLIIVDYSKPSCERRLWVVDPTTNKVLFNTWVAHGKNSGNVTASSFSNRPESLKSSIGVFVTGDIYSGKHGDSLRVYGLESGFNDEAYSRSIVFHGADYVSASIASTGRIGRSWGCWAVSQNIIGSLIQTIKHKALLVAYYPDKNWLTKSTFLH
ncbi:MAG: murein L,D-transpeptidase catalytic domain family protein [Gammaproteobacteria bacterium]|nr:MAG: murein L,D-transpeptidase catalytic domain family protein [Gammaproteobacteria bacterium]